MPITPRGWTLAAIALLLYFFANQTQVGWLYVFTALAAGLWLAALYIPRSMLRGLSFKRRVNGSASPSELELYAGETVAIDLELTNTARAPALQVRGEEVCPLALPDDRPQSFFVPHLPPRSSVLLHYETTCARRGWFEFPPVTLSTRAPFGLVRARRTLAAPTGVLVFPEYRELERFPLLDRMPAPQNTFTRLGLGGEFVGVREYRPGDSPRHVHWRTTARAGHLIVKEFAEETQPGLTLALDLRADSVIGPGDDNSLELAIKVAATLARYADQRGLPVAVAANSRRWPAPLGPLSWWALMNYLARVEAEGAEAFADCLYNLRATPFVAALFPAPDAAAVAPLTQLRALGVGVLAVVIDPNSFLSLELESTEEAQSVAGALRAGDVAVRVIGAEPDWEQTLARE
jgi:uncharacterized protein (DUF58 family)